MRKLLLISCLAAATGISQPYRPGPQVLTFFSDVDDSEQPYALYIPRNYTPVRKYPLVISLHGASSNHRLNLRRLFGRGNRLGETDIEASRYFPPLREIDFLVASPLARGTLGYQGIAEKDVYDVLADVQSRFAIDPDRIYLTGLSMGGGGTLWLGLTRPDLWAAIAPVCPATENWRELAGNALNVPVKLFQGELDPVVKAADTRAWQQAFLDAGVRSEYVGYPAVRHNAWDHAYKDGAIFDWFANFRRVRHPERVRFSTRSYQYNSAYWVRIDGLTPGALATVDAEFSAANRLTVRTTGIDGVTLALRDHPRFAPARSLTVVMDGTPLQTRGRGTISLSRGASGWMLKPYVHGSSEKRPGQEGPIPAAVSARHIYVYGTSGSPSAEELRARRAQAVAASEWSTPRSRLLLNFRVLADKDVRESDLKTSNLILFGSKETNSLIAQLAERLPLHLNAGAADYGLVFIVSTGERYAVINSGLPWWTQADQARRPGLPFLPVPFSALQSLPDFILFKGGLDNVIAEGLFDRNWQLPADAARKMEATGAVTLREPANAAASAWTR
ncbi:MAG: prolyl oligopeptidase family serine peptidase [Acidobacteria bacterium]|nr:prolyl oligopeptidase family serine peptidase [Acidobacteriota bacterium]